VNRTYHKWFSNHLNRDMELLVFGHAGAKVLVFPTRQGRFYDYENWGHGECLAALNYIRLYCVDGVDSESLYCHCAPPAVRVRRHQQYERYLLEEVIPLMRAENGSLSLVAHGCSIGAYHAMNLALRYPWLFRKVVALSGRYDLTRSFGHLRIFSTATTTRTSTSSRRTTFCPICTTPASWNPYGAWRLRSRSATRPVS
jgi:esterase/lipase superfamily enzyme